MAERKGKNLTWYLTPAPSDPLNEGRKIGLRWEDETGNWWGAIALLEGVTETLPHTLMKVAVLRLLDMQQEWELGIDHSMVLSTRTLNRLNTPQGYIRLGS